MGTCFTSLHSSPMLTLTIQYSEMMRVIESEVVVSNPFGNYSANTIAVWDTGAISSAISVHLASTLGLLTNVEKRPIMTVQGISYVDFASVEVKMVHNMPPIKLNVAIVDSIGTSPDRGILLGMDLISQGSFAISNKNGKTLFSFMIPTVAEIDFYELMNRHRRET